MWDLQSGIEVNEEKQGGEKVSYALVGWQRQPCVIAIFSQIETKFISVKNLI